MPHLARWVALLVVALAFSACQKKSEAPAASPVPGSKSDAAKTLTVAVVPEAERSPAFTAVTKHLELGGTLYGYVDVDGDLLHLAGSLQTILNEAAKMQPQMRPFVQQDFGAILKLLGLTDVKALGASSVPDGTGYFRNRLFVYTGAERHGLMAAVGGKPGPLKHVGLAPADAAFFGESEMDLGVVYRTIREVVAKVAGEPAGNELENTLKKAGEAAAISIIDLIYGLKGRSAVVVHADGEKTLRLPGRDGLVLPAISVLVAIDGVGPVVERAIVQSGQFRRSEESNLKLYEFTQPLPIEGLAPALAVDGGTLYFTTSPAFLKQCRAQTTGLAQTAEFKQALAQVGAENNGVTYVSPRALEAARSVLKLNPGLPPEQTTLVNLMFSQLGAIDRPLVASRINLADGILVRSHLNRSMKQDLAAIAIYNPVTIGVIAAMAIPSFQKVQTSSQEKAVLNNLRMLAAAADQHYLETGTTTATYDQLVGPRLYIKSLTPVAGENYRAIRFVQGRPISVRLRDGRMVNYAP
ncbi:MAG: hypothetical protein JNK23_11715 [Opitutaceae bacterium]|nr:hypothetical protein [Opitutaceae bacterium]